MAERTCLNCVYARCEPGEWLRCLRRGESLVVRCANHPRWPGELHDVPGVPCRNYQPRPPEPTGSVRWIPLGDGHYALVDAADYDRLSRYNWCLHNGYAMRWENHREVYMHREIMRPPKGMVVDHINHEKADNRRCNLRVCTQLENIRSMGKKRGTASKFRGISPSRNRKKWYAQIRYGKKRPHLGPFEDEAEAARAYDRMAVEYFREFAQLNFPDEWPPQRRQEIYDKYPHPPAEKPAKRKKVRRSEGKKERRRKTPKPPRTTSQGARTSAPKKPARTTKKAGGRKSEAGGLRENHQSSIIDDQCKGPPRRRGRKGKTKPARAKT